MKLSLDMSDSIDGRMQHLQHDPDLMLRQFVEGRNAACPTCGYNLRNTTSQRCPECGTKLNLVLESTRQRSGRWIAALICAAAPLGFYLTILGIAMYGAWNRAQVPGRFRGTFSEYDLQFLKLAAGFAAGFAIAIVITLIGRSFVQRRRPVVRWIVGTGWCSALVAFHAYAARWLLNPF